MEVMRASKIKVQVAVSCEILLLMLVLCLEYDTPQDAFNDLSVCIRSSCCNRKLILLDFYCFHRQSTSVKHFWSIRFYGTAKKGDMTSKRKTDTGFVFLVATYSTSPSFSVIPIILTWNNLMSGNFIDIGLEFYRRLWTFFRCDWISIEGPMPHLSGSFKALSHHVSVCTRYLSDTEEIFERSLCWTI